MTLLSHWLARVGSAGRGDFSERFAVMSTVTGGNTYGSRPLGSFAPSGIDPSLLKAASASVVESGRGAHALLETTGVGTPRYRLIPVVEWTAFKDTAAGAGWRVVAGVTSTGEAVEL